MHYIDLIIGTPLGYIMYFCFITVRNYGWAIILFTLIVKLCTLPIGIKVQKNSIKMVKMKPLIDELKRKYPGKQDKEQFMEEQIKLFEREKYSPAMGCFPMLIQIPIIIGLISVIYNPLKHLLRIPQESLDLLYRHTMELLDLKDLGFTADSLVIHTIQNGGLASTYTEVVPYDIMVKILNFNTEFLGINLSTIPTISNGLLLLPILSGISAFLLCILQNKENVLQIEQGNLNKWGMTIFLTGFSLYFAFVVPAGVGIYWIFSNLFAILQLYLLNALYDPKKYIDYEYLNKSKQMNLYMKKIKKEQAIERKKHKPREKADYKKFLDTEDKQLVFYSEKSGFYKYFQNVIEEIIRRSDITIHYITSDPEDAIFGKDEPQIISYYIGEHKLIPLMMKMDADMVVMTMPDLDQFHIKRSYVRKDVEYVFMFHGPLSMHMAMRQGCVDNFNTIFCVGQHVYDEIKKTEQVYNLNPKKLIKCGYGLIERLTKEYEELKKEEKTIKNIIIAPSWQSENIMDSCLNLIIDQLKNKKEYLVTIRPHPEYIKRYPDKMDEIIRYSKEIENVIIEHDFTANSNILTADVLISDWSGVAYEYAFVTMKPVIFINTPMKIINPEYYKLDIEPLEIGLRNKVGVSLDYDSIKDLEKVIIKLIDEQEMYSKTISNLKNHLFYNFGKSGIVGANYIINALEEKRRRNECDNIGSRKI